MARRLGGWAELVDICRLKHGTVRHLKRKRPNVKKQQGSLASRQYVSNAQASSNARKKTVKKKAAAAKRKAGKRE
jgi:hypothetical protein